jgi:hypothetical protein
MVAPASGNSFATMTLDHHLLLADDFNDDQCHLLPP